MTDRHQLGLVAAMATWCATAPLLAVFDSWKWLFNSVVVITVVAGAAAFARSARAPRKARPLLVLAALTVALTWLFPSGHELLWLLPGAGTLGNFGLLLAEAPAAVRTYAVPIPDHEALLFVAALGVGVVAMLVDWCTVEVRRPALAGLPMLAIYSLPVAVRPDGVPWLLFAVAGAGYLWLLAADQLDRVRRFGRRFTDDSREVPAFEPSPLAAAGRRLAAVGVLLAVAVPVAFPGPTRMADQMGTGFAGGRSGEVNLFATLSGRLNQDHTEELARVITTDPNPFYLRFATASEVSGQGFAPQDPSGSPVTRELPGPLARPGPGVTQQRYRAYVELTEHFNMPMIPTYQELVAMGGLSPQWLYDAGQQIVFSHRARAAELSYRFDYVRSEFTGEALRAAPVLSPHHPMRQLATVPPIPEVSKLVAKLTAEAETPYDQVLAIFQYFSTRNGFRYSLETGPETTGVAIVDFLTNQTGYCVQYAAAMAWLVRAAGLPARVAIGFSRGTNVHQHAYVLTNRNLHAWTEVFFSGLGWVPFDPTPTAAVVGGRDADWAPDPDAADRQPPGETPPDPAGDPSEAENRLSDPDQPGTAQGGLTGAGGSPWVLLLLATGALLTLLAVPWSQRARGRRRRLAAVDDPRARADAAWEELLDTMVDYRLGPDPAETPRATVARLVAQERLDESAETGLRQLGQAVERARYAREPAALVAAGTTLRAVRQALGRNTTRAVRLRAAIAPPSVLCRWRAGLSRASIFLANWIGCAGAHLAKVRPGRLLRRAGWSRADPGG